ncbi:hypothetical protein ARC20_17285 [Stenotrophomonas panacihumi]|uniref:DUF3999 domain-containing protein n=1 Tax=Stenotrophomonas panacihumi TaxID=676599 RepID=A0A0R0ATK9_9GAMM|nr:DUF3999 domain-containing protein [Stenotrophomonas panacihumi]KRG48413.1 hypothetical protein ARC20_17285 [Stenotrophomonas panacihumi]PTN54884.1 DUF3999 domain-containing protein [Stenotrophomonas panacihumi]
MRRVVCGIVCGLMWVPALALAAVANQPSEYVRQWPLQLENPQAGAYRVPLSEAVYRTAHSPTLADVQPFNAQGQPLPAALAEVDAAVPAAELQALPLFALPAGGVARPGDLELIAERDADGRIRRLQARDAGTTSASDPTPRAWLLDATGLHAPMRALRLEWEAGAAPVQAELRVEGSEDLRDWYLLDPHAAVVDLGNGAQRLQQRRILLDSHARYLRVQLLSGSLPPLRQVSAEVPGPLRPDATRWLGLEGEPQERGYVYTLPGRFPVGQVDVEATDNQATRWIVQSRDREDAPWVQRAGPWLAFQLGSGATAQRSAPQALAVPSRDRYWRLIPDSGEAAAMPKLRVGYRPETLVFIAQGATPYTLAAGSARVQRADAPLSQLVATLRRARGPEWQPARATLSGDAQALAGDAALEPPAKPIDWKTWLLWALLVGGALLVAGFAVTLLRGRNTTPAA